MRHLLQEIDVTPKLGEQNPFVPEGRPLLGVGLLHLAGYVAIVATLSMNFALLWVTLDGRNVWEILG